VQEVVGKEKDCLKETKFVVMGATASMGTKVVEEIGKDLVVGPQRENFATPVAIGGCEVVMESIVVVGA
jgi:hypothetical protein